MKANSHPKVVFDVDRDFKQLLVDLAELSNKSVKDYVLSALIPVMNADAEKFEEKLKLLDQLRSA